MTQRQREKKDAVKITGCNCLIQIRFSHAAAHCYFHSGVSHLGAHNLVINACIGQIVFFKLPSYLKPVPKLCIGQQEVAIFLSEILKFSPSWVITKLKKQFVYGLYQSLWFIGEKVNDSAVNYLEVGFCKLQGSN